MDDFFQTIYRHAQEDRSLDFGVDHEYRAASDALDELVESLHPDLATQDRFDNAVGKLLYRANVLSLAYGFRLGVRVTASDRL